MLLIIKKVFFLVGLTLYIIRAHSQIVTSTRNGVWTDPTTWVGGIVPTSVNATQIIIDHEVELPGSTTVSVLRTVVNNKLTLKAGATLNILADALPTVPDLQVTGTLVGEDGSVLNGTSQLNTIFDSGALYIHQQGPLGFIPYATWHDNSTFEIAGFKTSGYINIAHSDSWKQSFGNVVYNCPEQTIFVVDLNGYLRNIRGDFTIKNTNNQTLRLSTTQSPVITVGGSLIVEGPSEVWFSTNGTASVVNIQQDFIYRSSSSGPSYFATRGVVSATVLGDVEVDSPGPIRMTSSSADSIGVRQATLTLQGDLRIVSGTVIAPPLGSGTGRIIFNGTGIQSVLSATDGSSFQGNLDYVIENNAIVNLGNSVLSNTTGLLHVKGVLQVGSADPGGAIQLVNSGNIHIQGQRIFLEGSGIEYNGSSPQWIGDGHPSSMDVNLICNNPTEISLLQDVFVGGNFYVWRGRFDANTSVLNVHGDIMLDPGTTFQSGTTWLMGDQDQEVSASGLNFKDLIINKSGNSSVTLSSPLNVEGVVLIETVNTVLNSNGYLTLISASDDAIATACVGPLPSGAGISGNVSVQRYMSGEGRIYRYIASPVANATVASLMDDFPITGTFADPSTGNGINSSAPSFYFYDESEGGLQEGWKPYPTTGLASANILERGRGYAAFIRNGVGPTVWEVSGNLNQGEISLPLAFTANNAPSNGWNLVGNPYACTIDWDITGADGWTKQNISSVISIRDNGSGGGTFQYWDGDINYADIPNGQIASGQSMWVRATAPNPVLIIREGVKVTGGAAFYRHKPEDIPSFALILKRDGFTDKAYFKVRPGARKGLDDWDAVKQENDHFDIATFSADGVALAINARDKMPCGKEIIPIEMKDLKAGRYSLSLITKFDFRNFSYTWIDHYRQKEIILSPEIEIEFDVTDDLASSASDRFALQLNELLPDNNLDVSAPAIVCVNGYASVIIKDAQAGVHYSIWTADGKRIVDESRGNGSDLEIVIPADSLQPGENRWVVIARAVCQQVQLLPSVVLIKERAPHISVTSTEGCMGSAVTLTASGETGDLTFNWFETELSRDTLATTAQWITPPLKKRKVYYVCGTSLSGCASERFPVVADIISYDSAKISWIDASTVSSNYTANNQWYLNGQKLQDGVDQTLKLRVPGLYSLQVDTLGCITTDTLEFNIAGTDDFFSNDLNLYPNPVREGLYIESLYDTIEEIEIINALGMTLWTDPDAESVAGIKRINVDSLSAGIYFIIIGRKDSKTIIRFRKEH